MKSLQAEKIEVKRHIEAILDAFTIRTGWIVDGISLRTEIEDEETPGRTLRWVRYHVELTGRGDAGPTTRRGNDPRQTRPL